LKRLLTLLPLLFLVAAPALAQDEYPKGEVFMGYSTARTDLLVTEDWANGWELSGTYNFNKWAGMEADFRGYYGSTGGIGYQDHLYIFGPRFSYRTERVTPWGHFLLGGSNARALGVTQGDLAIATGGGLDVNVHRNVAIRAIQADWVWINAGGGPVGGTFNLQDSNNFTLSFGVVFKFGY
jgi:hypothetical protein